MTLLAHGVGSRTDLPLPIGLALYGAGAAILLSFAVLLLFWRTPRLGGPSSGRPVPARLGRLVDSSVVRRSLQAVALVVAVFVTTVAVAGRSLEQTTVRRIPVRRKNMQPHGWLVDEVEVRA